MQKLKHIFTFLLSVISLGVFSQKEKQILRDGNHAYNGGKPMEAANLYKKSLQTKQDFYKANYNLGDALYKTADAIKNKQIPPPDQRMTPDSAANLIYDQAAQQFEVVAKSVMNKDTAQKAWHNYGNSKLMQKSYEDAIYGYKHALRMNPADEDTRYNLAYAQRELKKQQQNQKNKDDKKDKEQNKDKEQQKKQQDKQNVNNQNDKDKQEAQQPQMSKEQAEQMLNALKNAEKKMQAQRRKKGEPGQRKKVEKDW